MKIETHNVENDTYRIVFTFEEYKKLQIMFKEVGTLYRHLSDVLNYLGMKKAKGITPLNIQTFQYLVYILDSLDSIVLPPAGVALASKEISLHIQKIKDAAKAAP